MKTFIKNLLNKKQPLWKFHPTATEQGNLSNTLAVYDMHPHDLGNALGLVHRATQGVHTEGLLQHFGIPKKLVSPQGETFLRSGLSPDGTHVRYMHENGTEYGELPMEHVMSAAVRTTLPRGLAKELLDPSNKYVAGKPHPIAAERSENLDDLDHFNINKGHIKQFLSTATPEQSFNVKRLLAME